MEKRKKNIYEDIPSERKYVLKKKENVNIVVREDGRDESKRRRDEINN